MNSIALFLIRKYLRLKWLLDDLWLHLEIWWILFRRRIKEIIESLFALILWAAIIAGLVMGIGGE